MYVVFDVRMIDMSLKGFVLRDREYFHPTFRLDGVDRTQKLDLSNIGLGADFLSADLIVAQYDEFEGKTFLGRIDWTIDPEHVTYADRKDDEFPHIWNTPVINH